MIYRFIRSFIRNNHLGYKTLFIAVDIHETVLKPTWSKEIIKYTFYPFAKKVLQMMSNDSKFILILWTSCYQFDIDNYKSFFKQNNIIFNYVNSNPEVKNTDYANFDSKFFIDLGFDDKFGFNPYIDWFGIYCILQIRKLWNILF